MKNLIPLLLILLNSSCGPIELEETTGQGLNRIEEINLSNRLESFELNSLRQVCNHLKVKDSYFKSSVINFNKEFNFEVTKKTCLEADEQTNEVLLKLISNGTNISFEKVSGNGDYFSNYESNSQGIIAPFCNKLYSNIGSFERFIIVGNKISWIYLMTYNPTYCPRTNSTYCVVIENGEILNSQQAKIIDRNSMAINNMIGQSTEGMIVGRKYETSQGCESSFRSLYSELVF